MVSPRRHDYGHLWTGTNETAYVSITNVGDGDLTLPRSLPMSRLIFTLILLVACGGNPAQEPALEIQAEAADRKTRELEQHRQTRDEVLAVMEGSLGMPADVRGRMVGSFGKRCVLLMDPQDPEGCSLLQDCRFLLLQRRDNAWQLSASGKGQSYGTSLPDRCSWALGSLDNLWSMETMEPVQP